MKYLINVHMQGGEIRTGIFLNSLEEAEEFKNKLQKEGVPFRKLVVYDAETKEAVRIYRQ